MKQLQQVFSFTGKDIRTITVNNEPWFVAVDVCEILELSNSRMAIQRLDDEDKGVSSIYTPGGNQELSVVNESGLYSLILGSRKPEARSFKRWITSEVLPSIRRTGQYGLVPQQLPSTYKEALVALVEQIEETERLQLEAAKQAEQLREQAPKITYYDEILSSTDTLSVTQIANDYGITAVRLNKILEEARIQYKSGGQWILRSEFKANGYTKSETFCTGPGRSRVYTKWTQKGRLFIHGLLTDIGVDPDQKNKQIPRRRKKKKFEVQKATQEVKVTLTLPAGMIFK